MNPDTPIIRRTRYDLEEERARDQAIRERTVHSEVLSLPLTPWAVNILDRAKFIGRVNRAQFLESSVRLAGALTRVLGADLIRDLAVMGPETIREIVIPVIMRYRDNVTTAGNSPATESRARDIKAVA